MAVTAGPGAARLVRLADGRSVAYAEYGAADGFPVLNCHGGLLCRTDAAPAHDTATRLGLRIVSPDRPGVGGSDRAPGRDTAAWAGDASELMTRLDIDRFAVMGWSLGGQYGLAVAAARPDRVVAAAVVAGCPPLDDPVRRAELNPLDRRLAALAHRRPRIARAVFASAGLTARHAPGLFVRAGATGSPPPDAEAMRRHRRWFAACAGEGLRDPAGVVDEYLAFTAPWGFLPEDVAVPVHVWQGAADTMVPPRWAEELTRRIPCSTLTVFEGEGHMIGVTRRTEVLRSLARRCLTEG